ncbi:dihydrofolate reductase family protein [soil metagenome]
MPPCYVGGMSTVFFDVGISVDGFIAGPNRGPRNPLGDGGTLIHTWMFKTASFLERLGAESSEPGGHEADDTVVRDVFARTGAYIMGRHMFEEGEASWPDPPPFRANVFVLTHQARERWVRQGGTTFHFVTDGIDSALRQARAAAGGKDVRISGGADTIRQYLEAGAIEEFGLHVAPTLLGSGIRLFDGIGPTQTAFEQISSSASPHVTHLNYRVVPLSKGK